MIPSKCPTTTVGRALERKNFGAAWMSLKNPNIENGQMALNLKLYYKYHI